MKIDTQQNCEGLISLLTGIIIPRPFNPKKVDNGFTLIDQDAKILKSIAKQLSKGIAMTDRQYGLVLEKLENYRDQFKSHDIDIDEYKDKLLYPLREIDRSHTLKLDKGRLIMRFPFNKKIIDRIEEVRRLDPTTHSYGKNTHSWAYCPQTLVCLVQIARKFHHKFEIEPIIEEIFSLCMEYEIDKEKYVPGIYDYKIKNLPEAVTNILQEEIGPCNDETLPRYFDRRHLFGINYFDKRQLEISKKKFSILSNKIMDRNDPTIVIQNQKFNFNEIVNSLIELNRFPVLIVLDNKKALEQLTVCQYHFQQLIHNLDTSVCFRLENTWIPEEDKKITNPFNEIVSQKNLNNPVDKNTKLVYINNSKLPKPLLQKGFFPRTIISFGGKGLQFNNVTNFIQQFDLQIIYEDQTSSVYWNKTLGKIVHA